MSREQTIENIVDDGDDIFIPAGDFTNRYKKTPEEAGYQCEWLERRDGTHEWGCWVTDDTQPIRRKRRRVDRLNYSETLDDSAGVLSEGQLSRRFAAESKALHIQKALGPSLSALAPPQITTPSYHVAGSQNIPKVKASDDGGSLAPMSRAKPMFIGAKRGAQKPPSKTKSRANETSVTPKPSTHVTLNAANTNSKSGGATGKNIFSRTQMTEVTHESEKALELYKGARTKADINEVEVSIASIQKNGKG